MDLRPDHAVMNRGKVTNSEPNSAERRPFLARNTGRSKGREPDDLGAVVVVGARESLAHPNADETGRAISLAKDRRAIKFQNTRGYA